MGPGYLPESKHDGGVTVKNYFFIVVTIELVLTYLAILWWLLATDQFCICFIQN
jgi:hypothetical protein